MSKVQGGMKCVKYLLFVFNFIFWLSGSLVLAVGLWLRFDPETVSLLAENDAPEHFFIAVYILIGAGGVMMLVGFFGCFGAMRESQCLLGLFFACLLIIFGAEVAAGVFGFLNKDKIIQGVQNYYQSSVKNGNGTAIVSVYQKVLECCEPESSPSSGLCTAEKSVKVTLISVNAALHKQVLFTCIKRLKQSCL
ncbi:CD81 protein-like isoform X2 [Cyprinus carpio]|uniref:CD81 protein-like isoform X2 n=1 Tax=Cyprinus carpio TaxID=7962 RepID=A0A9R0A1V7_CYPCA|nr:CD81 protein-like isoform X2 [Cyprinus carpio]